MQPERCSMTPCLSLIIMLKYQWYQDCKNKCKNRRMLVPVSVTSWFQRWGVWGIWGVICSLRGFFRFKFKRIYTKYTLIPYWYWEMSYTLYFIIMWILYHCNSFLFSIILDWVIISKKKNILFLYTLAFLHIHTLYPNLT